MTALYAVDDLSSKICKVWRGRERESQSNVGKVLASRDRNKNVLRIEIDSLKERELPREEERVI